ncbi:MAG: CBS domain-containing protein [Cytophagales bacterium]
MQIEISKEFIEQIREAIQKSYNAFLKETFEDFYPTDSAEIMYELDTEECIYIINLLDDDIAAEIISYIDTDTRKGFLKNFDSKHIASYLKFIDSDDAVDIVNELSIKEREEVIAHLEQVNPETAAYILELLRYEDDVAGGLMAKELIKANINWNVKQCIDEIRRQAENVERFYSVYVVDDEEKLLGKVSVKKLLLSKDTVLVNDIYDNDIIAVESYRDSSEVADIMQKYDLEAIPVVNVQGKLLGRITIDDVVDVIKEMAEKDIQAMTGISESIEEDDNIWLLSRARLPWLIIGMVGG